jgi:hypothetical protein
MKNKLALSFCLLAFGAADCDNPCIGLECPDVPKPDVGGDFDPAADWCAVYSEVFEPECSNCHDPGGTNVTPRLKTGAGFSADQMVAHLLNDRAQSPAWVTPAEPDNSQIWKRVGEGSMPPGITMGGSASEDSRLRKLVRDWIANGATTECLEVGDAGVVADDAAATRPDAGTPEAGPQEDTGPVDAGPPADPMCAVSALLVRTCNGCHGGNNTSGGLNWGSTSSSMMATIMGTANQVAIPYITPRDSDQSYLFLRIAGRGAEIAGGRAARMPQGGRWPEDKINELQNWIDTGANTFDCP